METLSLINISLNDTQLINSEGRNLVRLSSDGAVVYKITSEKELKNYFILQKYRSVLSEMGVFYPFLLKTKNLKDDLGQEYVAFFRFPLFTPYNILERFGKFKTGNNNDSEKAFRLLLKMFDAFEYLLPTEDFEGEDEEELKNVLNLLFLDWMQVVDDFQGLGVNFEKIQTLIENSQEVIECLPRVVQHKDANPSNWRIVHINGKDVINVIDMETLGLARRGWDEGRVFVQLSLDSLKQEKFLSILFSHDKFQDPKSRIYFWRVILFRCIRELALIKRGKYFNAILEYSNFRKENIDNIKDKIKDGLFTTASKAIKQLEYLLEIKKRYD
ncbi:MAG: hypothetical protein N2558_01555 [Patescibacteria group bacterium]|nr:hypothetical protein [Patescibacteria group bacterium]